MRKLDTRYASFVGKYHWDVAEVGQRLLLSPGRYEGCRSSVFNDRSVPSFGIIRVEWQVGGSCLLNR